ncbi:terminase small subunit, partial [Salmonella enterica subsp. enterica serovar Typhi]|nr:terminase small subunit [Salmonella enterica subsp. enterica serovar Typhi]NRK87592.1 terminase small subunit [Salmonella enterica subsp. enterica serovar Typhi]NRK92078.1 terminase small subunit [Salmonella enterica subsp. enterica serovar Typhi]NRL27329.1 terminase small subunit [Salmonella enterica subsp. enterica serovar Typhi]
SPKDWCEAQGLNYTSARRYIKKPTAQNAQQSAQKKMRTAQARKSAEKLLDSELTPQQKRFVAEYLIDQNATAAAERAGYSDASYGRQLLTVPHVAQAIAQQQRDSLVRTLASADEVLEKMWQLATFDANEISQYRRGCCRYCWGFGYHYQWRDVVEFTEQKEKVAGKEGAKEPDDAGGYGYNHNRDPNPDCPRCNGDGVGRPYFADTTKLSSIARLAYSGTKLVKGGIEISTISREKMFEAIMRRLGLAESELAQRLLDLEIRKRTAEAERLEQEVELKRKGKGKDDEPTVVIKLVNSPDGD